MNGHANGVTNGYGEFQSVGGQGSLKWDPRNLEIKTRSVAKALEPLVVHVTTLVNTKETGPSRKKKGRSKRAQILVAAVEKATELFIRKGEEIANENPDNRSDLMAAVDEVRATGDPMSIASREFAEDPCSSAKRGNMVRAARNLLSAVTRLLILADVVDVNRLLKSLRLVEAELDQLRKATTANELVDTFRRFGSKTADLINEAAVRQVELKDQRLRDDLAAARAVLKKNSMMLLTASKVCVRHPDLLAARENRDIIYRQVCEAVTTISDVAHGKSGTYAQMKMIDGPGELAALLDEFDDNIHIGPLQYNEVRTRPVLEERLENIISFAALMADSSCTRDERRERIVAECNAVRQALQDLLSEYMANAGKREPSDSLQKAVGHMEKKTKDLRRQLRKAVIDHVSDNFFDTRVPIQILVEAATNGDLQYIETDGSRMFADHANTLVEVAKLACSMSSNEDGVKMVRYASNQIELLHPQVVNAARILAARPSSQYAMENMLAYRNLWENQIKILTDAVDDISTIDDFLAVSENHILEDMNSCVTALYEGSAENLDRTAAAIQGRAGRVCNVVIAEMDIYEPCLYTQRVTSAVSVLRDEAMPKFAHHVERVVDAVQKNDRSEEAENNFIEVTRMLYDSVREIRRCVLLNRSVEDLDSDAEIEFEQENIYDTNHPPSVELDEFPGVTGVNNARDVYRLMPEEEKEKIAVAVETFRTEKNKFDREVGKWDDTGNDIIVMAKSMCLIMMEMTDFTRGKGPLKTTWDVIGAAKKISDLGTRLVDLSNKLADQCTESTTKADLMSYLQKIILFCHQLNITSKVKADVQNISGNLIVSGLDSATSLIQAAKNLMNAVVLTVKSSYVASTKYPRVGAASGVSPVVVWKMKAPEKKPLVRHEKPEEVRSRVRRGSQKKAIAPHKALSEFQSPAESV